MPLYGEDHRISGYCFILSIKIYATIQRNSNHKEDSPGASDLHNCGGVWFLLLSHLAAQQAALQKPPQDPPRVDRPGGAFRRSCLFAYFDLHLS